MSEKKIDAENQEYLEYIAYTIRRYSLESTSKAGSGHPTSCLSVADIISVLFFHTLTTGDTAILSKGHAAPALYAAYTLLGCITKEEMMTLRTFGSCLEGHPTPRFPYTPIATGSLGQGLSVGLGIAKINKQRCFVIMGDSEITEGSVWEAAALASYYKVHNLIALVDANGLGQSSKTVDTSVTINEKFTSFGWNTCIVNGNNVGELMQALTSLSDEKPTCIIAITTKGYGLPSIQHKQGFHGKVFTEEELEEHLHELEHFFNKAATYKPPTHIRKSPLCITASNPNPGVISFKMPNFQLRSMISTRKAYGDALEYLGSLSNSVFVLDAEVNNSTYTYLFAKHFPSRFMQAFIAEQNMVGMAMGLASQGAVPFASTFSAFLTRAYDQLRMAAISRLALRIAGSHAGCSTGQDGPSQMGLEDIALFRTLPGSIILYPCDAVSTYRCVELLASYDKGISYLRLTRSETPVIYANTSTFSLGGCTILKKSTADTITIVAAGITVFEALKAYDKLTQEKIYSTVIDCYSIKPLPVSDIIQASSYTGYRIIIVEDHYEEGGLGEALITALTTDFAHYQFTITHLAVRKLPISGKPEELRSYEGIDDHAIYTAAKNM